MTDRDDAQNRCPRELQSRSSFGAVKDAEMLGRVACSPRHFKGSGELKPSFISKKDVEERGLSSFRLYHLSDDEIHQLAAAIAATVPGNIAIGYVECLAGDAREIIDSDGLRALCVVDDPTEATETVPANPAHALVVASRSFDEGDIVRIRTELTEKFSALIRFQE